MKKGLKDKDNGVLATNKKVSLNYEILESFEAGIELLGTEVKSIRNHDVSLLGSHITIRGNEAYLISANIPPFQEKNVTSDYNPLRNRKLLLNKKEIDALSSSEAKKGLTIVPISMYSKGTKIKVSIAVVRGKKKFDKRETLKKRDTDREIRREISDR